MYKLTLLIRKEKFDIVHTNTPLAGIIGRLSAIFSGMKIKIFHTTGGIPITPRTSKITASAYFKLEKIIARKTDYIFCPSKIDIELYKSKGIKPIHKIVHCGPAGFDDELYNITKKSAYRKAFLEELNLDADHILIGIVARIVLDKGIKEFLVLAENIIKTTSKKVQFIIVGYGPLFNQLKEEYQNDKISFLGRRSDIPKIMMALDLFLFPSHREGYPVAVTEAMAGQTPVVAFDIDGCKEAVAHNDDGILVPFGDEAALLKGVERLLENPDLRVQMGIAARKKVEKTCTKKNHISKHLMVYEQYI